jgi:hypothetical protein
MMTTAALMILACGGKGQKGQPDAVDEAVEDPLVEERDDPAPDGEEDAGEDPTIDVDPDVPDESDLPEGDWIVPPAAGCTPAGEPCGLGAAEEGMHASYRKDLYYPNTLYDEPTDPPLDGGRFHVAAISAVTGDVTAVRVNGTNVQDMLVEPLMEWYHVWPTSLTAGEPVWLAFHSRNPAWDEAASGTITIETTAGTAVSGSFPVRTSAVPLTYVTTTEDLSTFVIHVKNLDTVPHTASRILLDGRDVTAADVACMSVTTIGPGESAMWTVPLCSPASPGEPWTVVVEYADAEPAVGVGRVMKPFFPVEAWPNSSECPFPGVDDENFAALQDAGIDTTFIRMASSSCDGYDLSIVVNVTAPATENFQVLISDGFLDLPDPATALTDTSGTAAFMTGDESDGEIYEDGVPRASIKAAAARTLWSMYPEVPVYNGAMTNKNVGSFAGMADIQGIDFYAAACAPHITRWGTHPPLRGPYDYLKNTRNNHAPLPTWMYAQGLHPGWNQTSIITGETIHVQPDPQEILVQALSVAAAGGKGIMWFQVNKDEADHAPARWDAVSQANWMIRGVRAYLREGDVTGMARVDGEAIVEMIRSRTALVVPVINLAVATAPTDVACAGGFISEMLVPHWILADQDVDVHLPVPADFGVLEVFEVTRGATADPDFGVTVSGRTLSLEDVHLSNAVPVRLFVLAMDEHVRDDVLAAATP